MNKLGVCPTQLLVIPITQDSEHKHHRLSGTDKEPADSINRDIHSYKEPPAMQLSFLGKSYTASTPAVDATITGETATFMGKSYPRKQFNVTQRHQPADLTYRGVHYTR